MSDKPTRLARRIEDREHDLILLSYLVIRQVREDEQLRLVNQQIVNRATQILIGRGVPPSDAARQAQASSIDIRTLRRDKADIRNRRCYALTAGSEHLLREELATVEEEIDRVNEIEREAWASWFGERGEDTIVQEHSDVREATADKPRELVPRQVVRTKRHRPPNPEYLRQALECIAVRERLRRERLRLRMALHPPTAGEQSNGPTPHEALAQEVARAYSVEALLSGRMVDHSKLREIISWVKGGGQKPMRNVSPGTSPEPLVVWVNEIAAGALPPPAEPTEGSTP